MKKVNNFSRYRKEKELSQTELVKRMNVTQRCVSSWQTGRTISKPYQMEMLPEILNVPTNELSSDAFNKVNS